MRVALVACRPDIDARPSPFTIFYFISVFFSIILCQTSGSYSMSDAIIAKFSTEMPRKSLCRPKPKIADNLEPLRL